MKSLLCRGILLDEKVNIPSSFSKSILINDKFSIIILDVTKEYEVPIVSKPKYVWLEKVRSKDKILNVIDKLLPDDKIFIKFIEDNTFKEGYFAINY